MATKLLNVRMDENMLKDLKEVCGELGINVTDAIKSFSKELIEKKTLPTENKEEDWENTGIDKIIEDLHEFNETCGDMKEYEKMNEKISNIILLCGQNLREFIVKNLFTYRDHYPELAAKFKEEYGEEFKNEILDIITNFYEKFYKDMIDTYGPIEDAREKFQQEKYISAMENIKKKNPELFNELLNDYTYNLTSDEGMYFHCDGYFETKKILEELLTTEEIKEYVKYTNEIESFNGKPEEELKNFKENIPEERWIVLRPILKKVREYTDKKFKEESEKALKELEEKNINK